MSFNLKIKARVRGSKHSFEIQKNSYLGSTDTDRIPRSVLISWERQGVVDKGKGNNYINRRKALLWVQVS